MTEGARPHLALRAGTRGEHERLDTLFARFDLSDRAGYRRFLLAHADALPAVERALDAAGFAALLPDWTTRRRTDALAADLRSLDAAMPPPLPAPALADRGAQWGAAYVIEGSRLGGAFLARAVGEGLPRSYLAAPQPPGRWRGFLGALDRALASPDALCSAQATAAAVFALFADAGQRRMEAI